MNYDEWKQQTPPSYDHEEEDEPDTYYSDNEWKEKLINETN